MISQEYKIIEYIQSLLKDTNIESSIPLDIQKVNGLSEIDEIIRNLRESIKAIGQGELSDKISGKGHLIGTVKNLQATLRNLIWQTKAISKGDFSHTVDFLGDFSDAFNNMVKKLESTINEVVVAKELLELFFETIPDPTMIISLDDFTFLKYNKAFEKLTGYSSDNLSGENIGDIKFFKDKNQQNEFFETIQESESYRTLSLELNLKNEKIFHGLFSSVPITIENKLYILSVIKDITTLKNLENKIRESEKIHRLLADNASDVIWVMDLTGKFTYISPSVEKLRGYTVEEVMQQSREEVLCPSSLVHLEKGIEKAVNKVMNNLPFEEFRGDLEQPCKDRTTVWTEVTVTGIYDKDSGFLGMLGVTRDITERRAMEEEIRRLTEVDRLTQLYNRLKLDYVIKIEIERANRSGSSFVAIMLDIDHFKAVNDNFGHIVGDEVLKEISLIIKSSIRIIDTAGRWGGEEFMIILPESDIKGGQIVAEKMRLKIEENQFPHVGKLTASFGVSEYKSEMSENELVTRADNAMYKAKNAGRNRVCIHE